MSNNDVSVTPPREIVPPPMPATLTFSTTLPRVRLHRWNERGEVTTSDAPLIKGSVAVTVPDTLLIVELASPGSPLPLQPAHFLPLIQR